MTVKDLDECEYRCYLDANCVSLNIKNKDPDETHECELNNSTHLEHDRHLDDDQLYYYRGAEVNNHICALTCVVRLYSLFSCDVIINQNYKLAILLKF